MSMRYDVKGDATTLIFTRKNGDVIESQIETEDMDKILSFKGSWHAVWNVPGQRFYVQGSRSTSGPKRSIFLHRYILDCSSGLVVDHINHDTLDNRKSNLRAIKHNENLQNRNGLDSNNTSGYRGVILVKKTNRWRAQINYKGKCLCFGSYIDIEEAARVVQEKRKELMEYASG